MALAAQLQGLGAICLSAADVPSKNPVFMRAHNKLLGKCRSLPRAEGPLLTWPGPWHPRCSRRTSGVRRPTSAGTDQDHARSPHHFDFLFCELLSFLFYLQGMLEVYLSGLKSTWKSPGLRKMELTPHESHGFCLMENLQAPNRHRQQSPSGRPP